MNPLYLFPLALIVPFIVAFVAFTPAYAGFFGAAYFIYHQPEAAHPLWQHKLDVFYIFDVYGQLFNYWGNHMASSSFVEFTLPLFGLPLLGIVASVFLTWKLVAMLVNFFRMASVT
ncbi:MAG: hypothetical protein ACOYJ2_03895 [Rickettsiales bacterium]